MAHRGLRAGLVGLAAVATITTATAGTATAATSPAASAATGAAVPGPIGAAIDTAITAVRTAALQLANRANAAPTQGDLISKPIPPAQGRSLGSRVRVRSAPVNGRILTHLYAGQRITVLCVQLGTSRDGYSWGRVRTASGVVGWTREDLITWGPVAPVC